MKQKLKGCLRFLAVIGAIAGGLYGYYRWRRAELLPLSISSNDPAYPALEKLLQLDPKARCEAVGDLEQLLRGGSSSVNRSHVYRGLAIALRDSDETVRARASGALLNYGGNEEILPDLIRALDEPDVQFSILYAIARTNPPAARILPDLIDTITHPKRERLRLAAIHIIANYHEEAAPAVSAVLDTLRDKTPDVRAAAAGALGAIGRGNPKVGDALRETLADPDRTVRWSATGGLYRWLLGTEKNDLDAFLARRRASDPMDRVSAVLNLGAYTVNTEGVIPALAESLDDPDPRVRLAALQALSECVENGATEVSLGPLVKALRNADPDVRWACAKLLAVNAPQDPPRAVPALSAALFDADPEVAGSAADALARIGPSAAPGLPDLARMIRADAANRNRGFGAIEAIGPAAVPTLLDLLRCPEKDVRQSAGHQLQQRLLKKPADDKGQVEWTGLSPALREALCDSEFAYRAMYDKHLEPWGPEGAAAIPGLMKKYRDPESYLGDRHEILKAVAKMGPAGVEALPILEEALLDEYTTTRNLAIAALAAIGPAAAPAIPSLTRLVGGTDPTLRRSALKAIRLVDPKTKELLPLLEAGLKDADPFVRIESAELLWQIDPAHAEILPTLTVAAQNPDGYVQGAALQTLGRIDPTSRNTVELIRKAFRKSDYSLRIVAIKLLAAPAANGIDLFSTFDDALRDPETSVRQAAAETLRADGIPAKEAYRLLVRGLDDPEYWVRAESLKSLRALCPHFPEAINTLVQALSDGNGQIRLLAAQELGTLGGAAKPAIEAMAKLLNDPEDDIRTAAATSIGQIGTSSRDIVRRLVEMAPDHSCWDAASAAANAIKRLGPEAAPAVSALIEGLGSRHPWVREVCAAGIGGIGPDAGEAIPALLRLIGDDENSGPQTVAGIALGKIGAAAVPRLREILPTLSEKGRLRATQALVMIDPTDAGGLALLDAGLKHEDQYIARIAAEVLTANPGVARRMLPALIEALHHPSYYPREQVARAIGTLGPDARAAIPALIEQLKRRDYGWEDIADDVAAALGAIGPDASEALPALEDLKNYWKEGVRDAARDAIRRIGKR